MVGSGVGFAGICSVMVEIDDSCGKSRRQGRHMPVQTRSRSDKNVVDAKLVKYLAKRQRFYTVFTGIWRPCRLNCSKMPDKLQCYRHSRYAKWAFPKNLKQKEAYVKINVILLSSKLNHCVR